MPASGRDDLLYADITGAVRGALLRQGAPPGPDLEDMVEPLTEDVYAAVMANVVAPIQSRAEAGQ